MESTSFLAVVRKVNQIFIKVSAKPGSKQNAITAVENGYIGISVKAPPRDGQANDGIKEYLAEILGLKKRDLAIAKGEKSSEKVVVIDEPGSLTVDEIVEKLRNEM